MNRLLALIAGVLLAAGCSTAASYTVPPQPPTAAQVAVILGATGFKPFSVAGGCECVVSGGRAVWHGKRTTIDTFASTAARNTWLQLAEDFVAVVPSAEGATWVAYPSVTS